MSTAEAVDCGTDVELVKPERSSENLRLTALVVSALPPSPTAGKVEDIIGVGRVDNPALGTTED